MKNFGMIGAAGYIAPRHMRAIKETGNDLVLAFDPYDGVGIMDSYFPNASYFTEFERFDRAIDKLKRQGNPVDYITICSPNYLHDSHIRFGLRSGSDIICEKPLVLNPWNLDAIEELEKETGKKVNTILQLRLHPKLIELRNSIQKDKFYKVNLTYITSRGKWYHQSWKGDTNKSGGITSNIGIHFFDMLIWLFGEPIGIQKEINNHDTAKGKLIFNHAEIDWFLSINSNNLPSQVQYTGKTTFRSLVINDSEIEFSDGFTDLHTLSYKEILMGNGFGIQDVRPAIELASKLR
ncbi:MAG: hypothetical protein RIR51_136 [Bacteroidota bacterium]